MIDLRRKQSGGGSGGGDGFQHDILFETQWIVSTKDSIITLAYNLNGYKLFTIAGNGMVAIYDVAGYINGDYNRSNGDVFLAGYYSDFVSTISVNDGMGIKIVGKSGSGGIKRMVGIK